MEGTGAVRFPVTTENPLVQKFINQGVGQLHGYWFFEAERSFRQAAMLDANCAIAYWGMAIANRGNSKRARGFIAEAVKRKAKVSPREAMYIDAMNHFFTSKASRKDKAKHLDAALKKIDNLAWIETGAALQGFWSRIVVVPDVAPHIAIRTSNNAKNK